MNHSALVRPLSVLSSFLDSTARDRAKSRLVRTPLEPPLKALRTVWGLRQLWAHPELHAIYTEGIVIDRVLRRIIERDSCCVDVGCHIGSTLSEMLRLAPRGWHAAFEPIASKAEWLRRRFPEVDVFEVALAGTDGTAKFFINTKLTGFSGLQRHGDDGGHQEVEVRTARLDDILSARRRVDFIKLDVEGGELGVLEGATGTLERHRPRILLECTASSLAAHDVAPAQMFEWLDSHGYGLWAPADYLARGAPLDLPRFITSITYPFQAFNFFAEPLAARL